MVQATRFRRYTLRRALERAAKRSAGDWLEKERVLVEDCHPKQRAFVLDPGRRVACLVGRGGGKTTGGRARFIRRMLTTPRARCVYITKTRDMAEELMWLPLKHTLSKLEIEAHFNETRHRVTFPKNGSTLRLIGCDDRKQLDKLRGQPFHEVHIDECQAIETHLLHQLIFKVIGPRLGDYNGVLCLYGTPSTLAHKGPFYESTRPGSDISRDWADHDKPEFAKWEKWSTHRWTLYDGAPLVPAMARLLAEALVEKGVNGWSDEHATWRTEYLGEWASDDTERIFKYRPHDDAGNEWNQWDPVRDRHGIAILPEGHEWRYVFGADLGHSDPFALEVFAYSPTHKDLFHVYEFQKKGMYARPIAELLIGSELNSETPAGIIGAVGWPEGAVADIAGLGGALLEELANVYGIHFEPAEKKSKFDAIELTNGDFTDGRIKILKGSKLEEQLLHLQWTVDDWGKLKEGKSDRNDCTDAFIYARRKAMHLFSEDPEVPRPPIGTAERSDMDMQDRNERDQGLHRGEYENYLSDDSYDQYF